jgi:hypothetical protein
MNIFDEVTPHAQALNWDYITVSAPRAALVDIDLCTY